MLEEPTTYPIAVGFQNSYVYVVPLVVVNELVPFFPLRFGTIL